MEGKERDSVRASPMTSVSVAPTSARQQVDRKKEFDRRVLALTKEFQELNTQNKQSLTIEDFTQFYQTQGMSDSHRIQTMFDEFDEEASGQITKSNYIKKCLKVEDQIIAKINDKVNSINVLKSRFDDTVKKLTEANVF